MQSAGEQLDRILTDGIGDFGELGGGHVALEGFDALDEVHGLAEAGSEVALRQARAYPRTPQCGNKRPLPGRKPSHLAPPHIERRSCFRSTRLATDFVARLRSCRISQGCEANPDPSGRAVNRETAVRKFDLDIARAAEQFTDEVELCGGKLNEALLSLARQHGEAVVVAALSDVLGASLRICIERGTFDSVQAERILQNARDVAFNLDPGERAN